MVEYIDRCVMAQLGIPDMKAPIAYAMAYPERITTNIKALDLTELSGLTFFKPDLEKFRCLALAYQAIKEQESLPAVMNAANEIAVEYFLDGKIGFMQIAQVIEETMQAHAGHDLKTIEEVLQATSGDVPRPENFVNRL